MEKTNTSEVVETKSPFKKNIELFLKNDFSIIPFKYKDKSPMRAWKKYQEERMILSNFVKIVGKKDFNIGVVTGKISGIVVVDVDLGADISKLDLPDTVTVDSGGGGLHFYYTYPQGIDFVKSTASVVAKNVDIRGDGGCIVAPPSTHNSGKQYSWKEGKGLGEIKMAELPKWIYEKTPEDIEKKGNEDEKKETISEMEEKMNTEGDRNSRTISYAGKNACKNNSVDELDEIVSNYNQKNNSPALSEKELKKIIAYVKKKFTPRKDTNTKSTSKTKTEGKEGKKEDEKKKTVIVTDDSLGIETIIHDCEPHLWICEYPDSEYRIEKCIKESDTEEIVPIPSKNSLLKSGALLFPTSCESELLDKKDLINTIGTFIKKYVDCSNEFLIISSYYVLFSYFYKRYEVLPYLRVIGDYGSGKSQLLQTIGSLCYNPTLMNGSASLATVFRVISLVKGTLVYDEADLPGSDTTNEFIKILNNGFRKGMNVFRSVGDDFSPVAFEVYGPKIIGGRMEFQDKATESRCLTEIMKPTQRKDIGKLDKDFQDGAEKIRNLCFTFWYKNMSKNFETSYDLTGLEPRQKQIIEPLLSMIDNPDHARLIIEKMHKMQDNLKNDRKFSLEGAIFLEIRTKMNNPEINKMYLKDIKFGIDDSEEFLFRYLSPRQIGSLLRQYGCILSRDGTGTYVPFQENTTLLGDVFKRLDL